MGFLRNLWKDKAMRPMIFSGVVVALALSCYVGVTCTGCETIGVADPQVLAVGDEVAEALKSVYDSSDNKKIVLKYLELAEKKIGEWLSNEDFEITEEDVIKIDRLKEGIQTLKDSDNPAYIRSRAKSLMVLADSIGEYTHEGIEEGITNLVPEELPAE